jgi:hypothetical protein
LEANPRIPSRLVRGDPLPKDLEILPRPQSLQAYKACKRAGEMEGRDTPPNDDEKDSKEGEGYPFPRKRVHACTHAHLRCGGDACGYHTGGMGEPGGMDPASLSGIAQGRGGLSNPRGYRLMLYSQFRS